GEQITSGSGKIQLGGYFVDESDWQQFENTELDLSGFAGETMRLVFEWRNDSSSGTQPPAAIDNIEITIPPCSQPMDLAVTGITKESADRKSTRLNSSHVKISYAVICWKKKNRR